MKEIAFKNWLESYGYNNRTVQSRISNVKHIEEYYNDLDKRIEDGTVNQIVEALSYSTDDERSHRNPSHPIPIKGNIRTGSATLKQALNLYIQFYRSTYSVKAITEFEDLKNQLKKAIDDFVPICKKRSYTRDEVISFIQKTLMAHLCSMFGQIEWSMEKLLDENLTHKDKADILGVVNEDSAVIIEIDTFRADQVGKKFVSRMALFSDKNVIYICICYPNTNANSASGEKETKKYWEYLKTITNMLGQGASLEKYFIQSSIR